MEIIAHRGASFDAPENTVAAVLEAWAQGADAVELDLRLTRDGRLVIFHDRSLRRITRVPGVIGQMTWAQVRRLDAGGWKDPKWAKERIPALDEILSLVPRRKRVFLELKDGCEVFPELRRCLRKAKPVQAVLIGFSWKTMAAARREFIGSPVYWNIDRQEDPGAGGWAGVFDRLIARATAAGFDGVHLSNRLPLRTAMIRKMTQAGLAVYVWTVDEPERARTLQARGANGVTTNRPAWLRMRL